MSQCPFVQDRERLIVSEFNQPMEYVAGNGDRYTYWIHDDGFGNKSKVQHCQLIGRKRDVFECLNESAWKACPHYRMATDRAEAQK